MQRVNFAVKRPSLQRTGEVIELSLEIIEPGVEFVDKSRAEQVADLLCCFVGLSAVLNELILLQRLHTGGNPRPYLRADRSLCCYRGSAVEACTVVTEGFADLPLARS